MSDAHEQDKGKNIHAGHRERLRREFMAQGIEGWSDHKVLELLLSYALPRRDVNPLAHTLIDRFGTLAGVLDALPDDLRKVDGLGSSCIAFLKLLPPVYARYQRERSDLSGIVRGHEDAARRLREAFVGARQEMVFILCMDAKRKFLGVRKVAEGSIYASDINIRRIAEEALSLRAAALYLAHNHVSNLALPSSADWQATDTVRAALSMVGLELVDHLIFSDDFYISLNETERDGSRPVYQLL